MKPILLGIALGLVATAAAAQDAPPPGCRWQGYQGDTILACKDGKGHWRRSGDDMIVGTYAVAKPKPKPTTPAAPPLGPRPAATTASTPATGAPVVAELAPPAPPPPPDAAAIAAADAADAAAAGEASTAPVAEPANPPPAAKTPWWKGFLDRLWQGILSFLKLIGLLH